MANQKTDPRLEKSTDKSSVYYNLANRMRLRYYNRAVNGLLCEGEKPPFGACYICESTDHWAMTCTKKNEAKKTTSTSTPCYICHQVGHWANRCPEKQQSTSSSTQTHNNNCFSCNGTDHWIKDCPTRKSTSNNCFACNGTDHWVKDCPTRKCTSFSDTMQTETLVENENQIVQEPPRKRRKTSQKSCRKSTQQVKSCYNFRQRNI